MNWIAKKRIPPRLLVNHSRPTARPRSGSQRRESDRQLSQIVTAPAGAKNDVMQNRAGLTHDFELAHQRMGGTDLVIPVGHQ